MQPNPNSEGLSRFLSSSFINPLHHQEQQQPLFYSTREGYELGFNQHEDILPPEDDQRLLETNPRGIDHPTPAEEDEDGDGEDPFYNPTENNQNNHNNQHQNHLLNLMEISYANYQQHYSQSHHQPSPQSILNPNPNLYSGPSEGWKIYQSRSIPPQEPSQPIPSTSKITSNNVPPEFHLQSELTERPPTDPPELESNQDQPSFSPPTVFIYPTEARDIGSDVPGQISLGPQNYRDPFWTAAWLVSLLYALIQSIWVVLFLSNPPPPIDDDDKNPKKINNLFKTLPILALLITITFGICLCSLGFLLMVKRSIKYLVYGTILGIPSVLGIIGLWTWSESLSGPSQGGMGYLSLLTIMLSGMFLKFIWNEREHINRTIQVLNLAIAVLVDHPSLVIVCLTLSMVSIVLSMPFISLIFQLILTGQLDHPRQQIFSSGSLTQVLVTGFIWSWSLNVLRNLQRIIIAGVVSHWYFNRHTPPEPGTRQGYSALDSTYQSISRALGPSLGTVCLSGLLLTVFDSLSKLFRLMAKLTAVRPTPGRSRGVLGTLVCANPVARALGACVGRSSVARLAQTLVGFIHQVFVFLNAYALLYAGITGFAFAASFGKIQMLVAKHDTLGLVHTLLARNILNGLIAVLSLAVALVGAHLLSAPLAGPATPLALALFALLPFWILRLVADLVLVVVDSLFLCWNIDIDVGANHSSKTFNAFVGKEDAQG